jgi:hypothetical protein
MRSGKRRGVTLVFGLACALAFTIGSQAPSHADGFHTIPPLVEAVDLKSGGPYYAPPVPYGHYAGKDLGGRFHKKIGGLLHGGLLGGHGMGHGCGACGGKGCGNCAGADPCDGNGCGGGHGHGHGGLFKKGCGLCGGKSCGHVVASAQAAPAPAPQVMPSAQCGAPGCGLFGRHKHMGCGSCGGKGCGNCGVADPCGSCGGKGCGLCRGGGTGCGLCGGKGCGVCAKARGLVSHLLGHDKIKWFIGPGGPVPLTPGYTPYVVATRSPRDFLAFPPFTP